MLKYTTAFRAIFVIAIITEVLGRGSLIPGTRQEKSAENELEKPRLDGRIVGGEPTTIEKHPHQVSLQAGGPVDFYYRGGGSIISPQWILTACHCVDGLTASQLLVRAGSSEADKGGQVISVSKIFQHEKYDSTTVDYDFALLKLHKPIKFDDTKQPAELPDAENELVDGEMCTTTGWGNTQNAAESPRWLREVNVPIFNQEKCNETYQIYGGITDQMICAANPEGGKGPCQGDSGGPLFCDGRLQGVVSWGEGCAGAGHPGVYAKVASVLDWISNIIQLGNF